MSDIDISRCRTCLTVEKDMISIFTDHIINGKLLQLSELIMLCSSIQINIDDKYTHSICTSCIQSVEQSYLFRLLCEKSDKKLKKEEILFIKEDISHVQCSDAEESDALNENHTAVYTNVETTYNNVKSLHESIELKLDIHSDTYENIETLDEQDDIDTIEMLEEHNETNDYIATEEHKETEIETFDEHNETYENIEILEDIEEETDELVETLDKPSETEENLEESELKKVIPEDDDVVIIETDLDKNVCPICFLNFPTSVALNRHMTSHRVTPLYFKCQMCPNQFISHVLLETHVTTVHKKSISTQKIFKCSLCTDDFASMLQLRIHVKKHQKDMNKNKRKKSFKCYRCGKVFGDPEKMKNHLKQHSSVVKQHKCLICDLAFSRRETLDLHLETHEKEKRLKKSEKIVTISDCATDPLAIASKPEKESTNKIIYVCKECKHELPTLAEMRIHLVIHDLNVSTIFSHVKFKCLECASIHSTIYEIFQHTACHGPYIEKTKFKCDFCDKIFHKRGKLREHQKMHQTKWPRNCKYCDVVIVRRGDFLPHMNANHDDLKGYPCERCGKKFFQEKNLTMHMKIHSGEKNYMCDVCGISFHAQNNLVSHRRIHSGVKPYKCTYCPKAFSQHAGLRSHMVNHTGERKYECDVCHKKFLRMGSRNNHRKIHTGQKDYSCHLCEKKFTASSTRNKHLLTHTGERNHVCEFCNKAFSRTSNLVVHRKIHLGDKPHVCHICNKGFIQKHVLQSHLMTHRRRANLPHFVWDESDNEKSPAAVEHSENQEVETDYNVEFKNVDEYIVP